MSIASSTEISPMGGGSSPPALTEQVRALFAGGKPGGMWDATDPANLWQDSAGTIPVTAYTQPIGRLLDLSGNGNHLIQVTAGARPAWSANGALPDGVDDFMMVPSLNLSAGDKLVAGGGYIKVDNVARMWMEFSPNAHVTPASFWLLTGQDGIYHQSANARGTLQPGGTGLGYFTSAQPNGYGAHIGRHAISGNLTEVWWNGLKGANGTGAKGTGNFGNHALYLFARAGTSLRCNTPTRRAIVIGIPAGQPQMSDVDVELIRLWLMEGV